MNLSSRMTTTSPMRKMMPTALPRNLNMGPPERDTGGCAILGKEAVG
jgi:hypothetical protein